jgi:hypothetical protein
VPADRWLSAAAFPPVRTRPAETEVIADFLNTSSREPTVEVNLTRIHRKLNIRSRAELGRRIDRLDA